MYELPLFPLNTVLFPGMPLRLHIFEERYKLMIGRCYGESKPFGVSLIRAGEEVGASADPYLIGCTALISEVEPLGGGRMNIVASGVDRFQIIDFKHDEPYLVGLVEDLPFAQSSAESLEEGGHSLRPWVRKYLQILSDASKTPFDTAQVPRDPLRLAFLASFLVNIPSAQKQDLLETLAADDLILNLRNLYRREVTLLEAMLQPHEDMDSGVFSHN